MMFLHVYLNIGILPSGNFSKDIIAKLAKISAYTVHHVHIQIHTPKMAITTCKQQTTLHVLLYCLHVQVHVDPQKLICLFL